LLPFFPASAFYSFFLFTFSGSGPPLFRFFTCFPLQCWRLCDHFFCFFLNSFFDDETSLSPLFLLKTELFLCSSCSLAPVGNVRFTVFILRIFFFLIFFFFELVSWSSDYFFLSPLLDVPFFSLFLVIEVALFYGPNLPPRCVGSLFFFFPQH